MNADEFLKKVSRARKNQIYTSSKVVEMTLAEGIAEILRRLKNLEESVEYLAEKETGRP